MPFHKWKSWTRIIIIVMTFSKIIIMHIYIWKIIKRVTEYSIYESYLFIGFIRPFIQPFIIRTGNEEWMWTKYVRVWWCPYRYFDYLLTYIEFSLTHLLFSPNLIIMLTFFWAQFYNLFIVIWRLLNFKIT